MAFQIELLLGEGSRGLFEPRKIAEGSPISDRALPALSKCVIIQILCDELATRHYKFHFVISNFSTMS